MYFDGIRIAEGAELNNLLVPVGPELPGAPEQGEMFFADGTGSATQGLYLYDGSVWVFVTNAYVPVNKAGDTMLGNLILNADPTVALGAATKQYVDNYQHAATSIVGPGPINPALIGNITESQITDSTILARVGDAETITGSWSFSSPVTVATPTANGHATTKLYVDNLVGGAAGTPGGSTTQLQYNNAGAFGGLTNWSAVSGSDLRVASGGAIYSDGLMNIFPSASYTSGDMSFRLFRTTGATTSNFSSIQMYAAATATGHYGLFEVFGDKVIWGEFASTGVTGKPSLWMVSDGVVNQRQYLMAGWPSGNVRFETTLTSLPADPGIRFSVAGAARFESKVTMAAATTAAATLNVPHGTAPTSPTDGDVWTTTAGVYVRINGSTIGPLGAGGTGFAFQSAAPGAPAVGDRWIDSDTAIEYTYVNDGTSSQWIETGSGSSVATMPQNSQSANYTAVLSDAGKHIFHPSTDTSARTFTIPANSSVEYPVGTALTFINENGAGVITIAITTDTMRLAGAGTTGNRTLAANGVATAIKITATGWIISGTGLT